MKFEFVAKVDGPVMSYGGVMVSTGDVVEFDGWIAEKAKANPNYRQCDQVPQEEMADVIEQPKRRGRPPKVKDGD